MPYVEAMLYGSVILSQKFSDPSVPVCCQLSYIFGTDLRKGQLQTPFFSMCSPSYLIALHTSTLEI